MHYVYILRSLKDGTYYKGCTENLKTRLIYHNKGKVSYSSKKAPFILAWYCLFKDKDKAYSFEKYLKSGSGFAFAKKHLL